VHPLSALRNSPGGRLVPRARMHSRSVNSVICVVVFMAELPIPLVSTPHTSACLLRFPGVTFGMKTPSTSPSNHTWLTCHVTSAQRGPESMHLILILPLSPLVAGRLYTPFICMSTHAHEVGDMEGSVPHVRPGAKHRANPCLTRQWPKPPRQQLSAAHRTSSCSARQDHLPLLGLSCPSIHYLRTLVRIEQHVSLTGLSASCSATRTCLGIKYPHAHPCPILDFGVTSRAQEERGILHWLLPYNTLQCLQPAGTLPSLHCWGSLYA